MRRKGLVLLLVFCLVAVGCGRPVDAPPTEPSSGSDSTGVNGGAPGDGNAPGTGEAPGAEEPPPAGTEENPTPDNGDGQTPGDKANEGTGSAPTVNPGDGTGGGGQSSGQNRPPKPPTPVREPGKEPPRVEVRGIYLTQYTVAYRSAFEALLNLVERTELNAMVINVKDDEGFITFEVDDPVARAAGAITQTLGDVKALTADLDRRGIYSIARVVTFKDHWTASAYPDMAVHSTAGGIWHDHNGVAWLNPYSMEAWDYNVRIAKAAAQAGFREIQFDYVRFPSDGNMDLVLYPQSDERSKAEVIGDFLAYARAELAPYGVWVSADVFGLVTSVSDDMGIGQNLEEVARGVDYISPMVYPSHYTPGNLGVPNPNAMPYDTVYRSMLDAAGRLEGHPEVTVRPWLQDFSWGHPYGPDEVRAQIQAVYDAGYKEWILWNAANVYTEGALQPAP